MKNTKGKSRNLTKKEQPSPESNNSSHKSKNQLVETKQKKSGKQEISLIGKKRSQNGKLKKDDSQKSSIWAYFEPNPRWYTIHPEKTFQNSSNENLSEETITRKYEESKKLLQEENAHFEANPSFLASDRTFYTAMLKSGTLNDKISTLSVMISASPLHAMKSMDTLMTMAKKNNRHESLRAILSLRDVMMESLLPPRKLKYFRDQPLSDPKVSARHLILWAFEDYLKRYYFELIKIIEVLSHDVLVHVRQQMVETIFGLVKSKPEQEQNLLKLLVNKLGDNDKKVASKTTYLIQQLSNTRRDLKLAIVSEIEQYLLLSNSRPHAQYYAVICLNQTILTRGEVELANKLIDVYFVFFRQLLGVKNTDKQDKNEKNGKLKGKGNNKFSKDKKDIAKKKKGSLSISHQDLPSSDSLNSKIIAAILTGVNRAFPFAKVEEDVYDHNMDILFRITYSGTFNTSVRALMLIFQVCSAKEDILDRFYRTLYESLFDVRLITSSKHAIYLNLLFKALKADESMARVKAFVKRILQTAAHHQPPFICGVFHLISELMNLKPGLRALIFQPEENDEEEHFVDAPEEDDEDSVVSDKPKINKVSSSQPSDVNTHKKYDGRKRDPQYSNADQTCLWELAMFFFESLSPNSNIVCKPNSQRNPKKSDSIKGSSKMQPSIASTDNILTMKKGAGITKEEVVNSEEFWRKKVEDIPVDQIFFHRYFTQKRASLGDTTKKTKKKKSDTKDVGFMDAEGSTDEEEEEEIWRVMTKGLPNVDFDPGSNGENDDDDQDDLEDFEFDENEDENEGEEIGSPEANDSADADDFVEDEDDLIIGSKKIKRQKLKHLPTFASFDDYAEMLEDD
ncbi:1631_t:CDS:10 [Ambispora leptoticha]|uniref:1631_t:CDS:1 n=1 Tax=Ambispora leptoticha TaxID=144679 RepID=A0A9N8ZQ10_9GLOM|nr:1631_t:CDS:10 [Ambispora leptoticha]